MLLPCNTNNETKLDNIIGKMYHFASAARKYFNAIKTFHLGFSPNLILL